MKARLVLTRVQRRDHLNIRIPKNLHSDRNYLRSRSIRRPSHEWGLGIVFDDQLGCLGSAFIAELSQKLKTEVNSCSDATTANSVAVCYNALVDRDGTSAMLELEASSARIARALAYAREHLTERLSIEVLAGVASLSERQFGRAFRSETGETLARAVERMRVEAARARLEGTSEPIEISWFLGY
jgi:AraC-like DNA-binding protein